MRVILVILSPLSTATYLIIVIHCLEATWHIKGSLSRLCRLISKRGFADKIRNCRGKSKPRCGNCVSIQCYCFDVYRFMSNEFVFPDYSDKGMFAQLNILSCRLRALSNLLLSCEMYSSCSFRRIPLHPLPAVPQLLWEAVAD